ncbi:MAG TPA: formyltetrahydrofolate deformylase [Solirubrobacteraceae bacterium]|nr:formyltetrahydrofolate deformylase [Solirubrobacteraceae bacterium]
MASITRLLISCPDQPGIVAATARLLADAGANIIDSDQHTTDPRDGTFYMRMEFDLSLDAGARAELETRFASEVAEPLRMQWRMADASARKRVAILVSREEHCLLDLLWRARRGELAIEVPLVVSNHELLRDDVEAFGLRYEHVPVVRGREREGEVRLRELLAADPVDLIVLARYMRILSGHLLDELAVPVINIHHSFLPAFAGAGPYAQAKARGVKLIGATAHYVTERLDDGPIIEQDTVRVTHRDDVPSLIRLGSDIERVVLARAVRWHCEDRVLRAGDTTVVF